LHVISPRSLQFATARITSFDIYFDTASFPKESGSPVPADAILADRVRRAPLGDNVLLRRKGCSEELLSWFAGKWPLLSVAIV
jgi:hypothetical protein